MFIRKSIQSFGNASSRKQDFVNKKNHRLKKCSILPVMSESLNIYSLDEILALLIARQISLIPA